MIEATSVHAIACASRTSPAHRWPAIDDQPTIRRENRSCTCDVHDMLPSRNEGDVRRPRPGRASDLKSRSTKSAATLTLALALGAPSQRRIPGACNQRRACAGAPSARHARIRQERSRLSPMAPTLLLFCSQLRVARPGLCSIGDGGLTVELKRGLFGERNAWCGEREVKRRPHTARAVGATRARYLGGVRPSEFFISIGCVLWVLLNRRLCSI